MCCRVHRVSISFQCELHMIGKSSVSLMTKPYLCCKQKVHFKKVADGKIVHGSVHTQSTSTLNQEHICSSIRRSNCGTVQRLK